MACSLKALVMSTFRQHRSVSDPSESIQLDRTAASKPLDNPMPTWPYGRKKSGKFELTAQQQRRLTRRRKTSPTATGCIPPCFFIKAVKSAPDKQELCERQHVQRVENISGHQTAKAFFRRWRSTCSGID